MAVVCDRTELVVQLHPEPMTRQEIVGATGGTAFASAMCFAWSFGGSIPAFFAGALFSTVILVPVLYLVRWRELRAESRTR